MPILVHVPDGPIRQLAVVDHRVDCVWPEAVRKRPAGELGSLDALQLALAHRSHGQRIPHDRLVEPRRVDRADETFWKDFGLCKGKNE